MAIQLPDVGTGVPADQTGDSPWLAMKKVRENFADPTNAASKTIGVGNGQVSLNNDLHKALHTTGLSVPTASADTDANTQEAGDRVYFTSASVNGPVSSVVIETYARFKSSRKYQIAYRGTGNNSNFYYRFGGEDGTWSEWATIYSTGNTTKEAGTGYLVASSPVLKIQHDSFEKVHEAEQLDIEVENIKTGVYEITGTTGLRENDGWNLKPPKDVNGNVLCICEATESNGVITLKTYKKKFDFETVSIVADYGQPTDIPEGATVMLRFNDLPIEAQEELPTDGG